MSDGNAKPLDEGRGEDGGQLRFLPQALPEVILIEPPVRRDERGFFFESYNAEAWKEAEIDDSFGQDNHSLSTRGVLRGLHAQAAQPQTKLVRVNEGEIYDVAVDIRPGSGTFGKWVAATLSAENFRQLYIPAGFAHGFCVLGDRAQVSYKVSGAWNPDDEITLAWNDPQLAIDWPLAEPILSEKDRAGVMLTDLSDRLGDRSRAGEEES